MEEKHAVCKLTCLHNSPCLLDPNKCTASAKSQDIIIQQANQDAPMPAELTETRLDMDPMLLSSSDSPAPHGDWYSSRTDCMVLLWGSVLCPCMLAARLFCKGDSSDDGWGDWKELLLVRGGPRCMLLPFCSDELFGGFLLCQGKVFILFNNLHTRAYQQTSCSGTRLFYDYTY